MQSLTLPMLTLRPCTNHRLQFGGSSVATAERMREVADIVCSFPEHLPCVVLSAMGKVRHALACWGGSFCVC